MTNETLEEAAKKYSNIPVNRVIDTEERYFNSNVRDYDSFIDGAKWQAERSYSEEYLVQLLNFVSGEYNISNGIGWFHTHESNEDVTSKEVLDKWFEQFKKK
jgi:hypothetical protein